MIGFLKLMLPSQPFRFKDIKNPSKSGFETTLLELLCNMIPNWSRDVKICSVVWSTVLLLLASNILFQHSGDCILWWGFN